MNENEGALGYMRLARAGIAHLKAQIEAHGIDCDWREKGKYQAAVTDRGVAEYLDPFAEALARLGEPFEWIEAPVLGGKARNGPLHARRLHAGWRADESGRARARSRGFPPRERRSP